MSGKYEIDEYTGLTIYPDDEWAEERIRILRIAEARIVMKMVDASPERKAFAHKTLLECGVHDPRDLSDVR